MTAHSKGDRFSEFETKNPCYIVIVIKNLKNSLLGNTPHTSVLAKTL